MFQKRSVFFITRSLNVSSVRVNPVGVKPVQCCNLSVGVALNVRFNTNTGRITTVNMWRQTISVLEVDLIAFERKQNSSFALDQQVEPSWLSALLH